MNARGAVLWLAFTPLGCNALTGVSDLEPVDCIDCIADSGRDSSSPRDSSAVDAGAAIDTAARDTGAINPSDVAPPDTGCTSNLACNDGNACTTDTCVSGECMHTPVDNDGDGESPSSLGDCGTDCDDNNPNVFSKQTAFFTTAYVSSTGLKSFDYNCNGIAEKQYSGLTVCDDSSGTCVETSGWASTVPACGQLSKRAICVKALGCARGTSTTETAQPCR